MTRIPNTRKHTNATSQANTNCLTLPLPYHSNLLCLTEKLLTEPYKSDVTQQMTILTPDSDSEELQTSDADMRRQTCRTEERLWPNPETRTPAAGDEKQTRSQEEKLKTSVSLTTFPDPQH